MLIARAGRARGGGRQTRGPVFAVAAGGLVYGGTLIAQQLQQTECAAERRTDFVVLGGGPVPWAVSRGCGRSIRTHQ